MASPESPPGSPTTSCVLRPTLPQVLGRERLAKYRRPGGDDRGLQAPDVYLDEEIHEDERMMFSAGCLS